MDILENSKTSNGAETHSSFPKKIECFNPATEEYLGEAACLPLEQYPQAFEQARTAQKLWQQLPHKERKSKILKIRDYLLTNVDDIAKVISQSTGKTMMEATLEVLFSVSATDWYAKQGHKVLKPQKIKTSSILFDNKKSILTRQALGVVGVIAPWNFPFVIPFGEIIMALITGNAVMYKVAEETAMVGLEIEKALAVAELPDGLTRLLLGDPPQVSSALFEQGIDKIFFTGSVRVGKLLMQQASKTLTPVSLELGGKDGMIVLDDANLERAANGALWGAFFSSGQVCASVERIYVHSKVADKFTALLKDKASQLRQGIEDGSLSVDIGSMTVDRQIKTVKTHVQDALENGANILHQTELNSNLKHFYPATILTHVNHDMKIMTEETFGPVIGVMPFDTDEEALALINDSNLGLTSSVWSNDLKRARKLAEKIDTGITSINDHIITYALPEVPWLGRKESGLGATHSYLGLEEMTKTKAINYDTTPAIEKNLWWYPYTPSMRDLLVSAYRLVYGDKIKDKAKSLQKLITESLAN